MELAYSLGPGYPQGLKALAYRLCGMEMSDFDDVVRPFAVAKFHQWLTRAIALQRCGTATVSDWGVPIPLEMQPPVWDGLPKSKRGKMYREWLEAVHAPKELIRYRGETINSSGQGYDEHFVKVVNGLKLGNERQVLKANNLLRVLEDKTNDDPWKRVREWEDNTLAILESRTTPHPHLSIIYTPWDAAMHYSARDADATIRVYHSLRRLSIRAARNYSIPI
jgi:hypothetical protein